MAFKRKPVTLGSRLQAGAKTGIATALGLYTVAGAVLPFIGLPAIGVAAVLTAPTVIAMTVAYLGGRDLAIPPMIIDELCHEASYKCGPCTSGNLRVACDLVKPFFGSDYIECEVLEQWRLQNPQGFMQIETEDGELVACFVILGIEQGFMGQFIEGSVVEGQITGELVLPMRASKRLEAVYFSGVVVRDARSYLGAKRARIMLWCILKYLKHHYGLKEGRTLYAVALNKHSERLLQSLEFKIATPAGKRRDKHNLFSLAMNGGELHRIAARIGDLSSCVRIRYS